MNYREFRDFEDFYPYYLSQHLDVTCRQLHLLGAILGIITLVFILVSHQWLFLELPLLIGYGMAWIGHFFFEKNKPATFDHPLWSLRGDYRMLRDMITGQLQI